MKVDTALTNRFETESLKVKVEGSIVAVIDIIRATSSIAALFGSGIRKITIAATLEQAYEYKRKNPSRILCGEENGLPPHGFDYGNSPLEFSGTDMSGKEAILKTTNGTVSFLRASGSPAVYSLSALNFRVTLDKILKEALELDKDILFICSGEQGRIAYDDAYIAGMAVRYIMERNREHVFSDSSLLVLSAVINDNDMENALAKSTSAISLRKVGLGSDISFCARLNEYDIAVKAIITDGILELLRV